MSIKEYIINNFKNDDIKNLENAINQCIAEQDDETLPGMGVFLELIWQNSNNDERQKMLEHLHQAINK